jgi:hypothetical protein
MLEVGTGRNEERKKRLIELREDMNEGGEKRRSKIMRNDINWAREE